MQNVNQHWVDQKNLRKILKIKKGLKASNEAELSYTQSTVLAVNNQPEKSVMETNY